MGTSQPSQFVPSNAGLGRQDGNVDSHGKLADQEGNHQVWLDWLAETLLEEAGEEEDGDDELDDGGDDDEGHVLVEVLAVVVEVALAGDWVER